MKENSGHTQGTPPAPKGKTSDFRKAMLWTAIPIVVLSVASMTGVAASGGGEDAAIGYGLLWAGALLYFVGALITVVVFALTHKRQLAAGMLAGLGIAIVSMGATCFAGNSLSGGSWFG